MGCPMVFKGQGSKGSQIAVEIYDHLCPSVREAIDDLEGHPHTYRREIVDCIDLEGNTHSCWLYFGHSIEPSEHVQHTPEIQKERIPYAHIRYTGINIWQLIEEGIITILLVLLTLVSLASIILSG